MKPSVSFREQTRTIRRAGIGARGGLKRGMKSAGTPWRGGTTRFGPLTTGLSPWDHEISPPDHGDLPWDHEISPWDVRSSYARGRPKRLAPVSVSPLRRRRFWGSPWGVQLSRKGIPR